MVVLVDGSAYCCQAVVAVGQDIGQRELFHTGCFGRLDDTDKGDIMGGHRIKAQPQVFHVLRCVVGLQDRPGNRPFPGFCPVRVLPAEGLDLLYLLFRNDFPSVYQVNTAVI